MSVMFQKKSEIEDEGKLTYMRSFMRFGLPLNVNGTRYKNSVDKKDEQKLYIREY